MSVTMFTSHCQIRCEKDKMTITGESRRKDEKSKKMRSPPWYMARRTSMRFAGSTVPEIEHGVSPWNIVFCMMRMLGTILAQLAFGV